MQTLVMNLAICISFIVIVWAIRYIRRHPEWLIMQDPEDEQELGIKQDANILNLINKYWDRREAIATSTSSAELESEYWEVEAFEDDFRNQVPDDVLKRHTNSLYECITTRRDKLGLLSKQVKNSDTYALSV